MNKTKPQKIGWGPWSAVTITLLIYFGSQVLAGLAIAVYSYIQHIDHNLLSDLIERSVGAQFGLIVLIETLTIYLLWLFLGVRKITWQDIGLKRPKIKNFAYAPVVFTVYFLMTLTAVGIIKFLIPGLDVEQKQQVGFEGAAGGFELTLVFICLVLLPAIVEEILIRGFLYGGLVKKFSKIKSATLASVIFAAAHLQFGSGAPLLWIAAVDTFILSMALVWLRERTGNLYAGMLVHMIKNCLAFVGLFIIGRS